MHESLGDGPWPAQTESGRNRGIVPVSGWPTTTIDGDVGNRSPEVDVPHSVEGNVELSRYEIRDNGRVVGIADYRVENHLVSP